MRMTIQLDTSNSAFGDSPHCVGLEAGRILSDLGRKLAAQGAPGCDEIPLFDCNGNRVGAYVSTEWDHEAEEA
jgi:hypothetical protein